MLKYGHFQIQEKMSINSQVIWRIEVLKCTTLLRLTKGISRALEHSEKRERATDRVSSKRGTRERPPGQQPNKYGPLVKRLRCAEKEVTKVIQANATRVYNEIGDGEVSHSQTFTPVKRYPKKINCLRGLPVTSTLSRMQQGDYYKII
ncbi:hypothetical protein ACTXT7_011682 [Hymenolepis weldensis]